MNVQSSKNSERKRLLQYISGDQKIYLPKEVSQKRKLILEIKTRVREKIVIYLFLIVEMFSMQFSITFISFTSLGLQIDITP